MKNEFIPYEQAFDLKELGYDEPCLAFYDGKGDEKIYFNTQAFKYLLISSCIVYIIKLFVFVLYQVYITKTGLETWANT